MAKSALKFKDSVAQYERIAAEVAARRFSGIYLLMGEESYFIDALSDQLAATILDEAARAFNQITVYGRDSEAGQVINLCRQMPMMGQYQVVILKEAQQLKGLDKLALYTQKPSPTTILVICHKEKNADKRSAFYKGCAANGTVLESVRPRDYEIAAWLQQFIRQKGFTIDPKALSMLTDHLGTDIAKISNEIRKLTVSLPEGTQRITDADIEANIGISKDFNNFELCKAVVTRDMARAHSSSRMKRSILVRSPICRRAERSLLKAWRASSVSMTQNTSSWDSPSSSRYSPSSTWSGAFSGAPERFSRKQASRRNMFFCNSSAAGRGAS